MPLGGGEGRAGRVSWRSAVDPRSGPSARTSSGRGRAVRWVARLGGFGVIQVSIQLCLGLAGLLLIRNLPKTELALLAIVNSFQTMANVLAELGIGLGLRSIGGRVWKDRERLGQLINTALALRYRYAIASITLSLLAAAWMLSRNGASTWTVLALSFASAVAVVPQLAASVFVVCLQLHGDYHRLQRLDLLNAVVRLVAVGILVTTRVSALAAVAVSIVTNWIHLVGTRTWAARKANLAACTNQTDGRDLASLSRRSLPNALFFCVQGQIALAILAVTGNPSNVADFSALGRLAPLLAVFSAAYVNILAPEFARCQDGPRLKRLYTLLVGSAVAVTAPLVGLAWLFPAPLIWLLGPQYRGLASECLTVVAAGCVSQVAAAMWTLNASRAWIRLQAPLFIPVIAGAQLAAAVWLDLTQFQDVLIFNLVAASAPLPLYALDAWLGLSSMGANDNAASKTAQ